MIVPQDFSPPSLWRRMAAFLYEGVLLFGVVVLTGLVYSPLTNQRHALKGQHGLQAACFVLIGLYFIWFWCRGGQTLAQKTWHLRVVDLQGGPLSPWRALMRYLLSWLWFLPALLTVSLMGLTQSAGALCAAVLGGILAYLLIARLHPRRQFLHDVLCGTQIITQRPAPKAQRAPQQPAATAGDPS
ncbi:RDD family protein [Roseateles sp. SL47]|uniref:RDD family protein n=1 Tax=Roseateles sp. SL47 TaxID=2995138 RepID=UPI00226FDE3D|nr:RDD family protein [Roseateles sp. SL47]WAC72813.1 RDD family protein [Roseateles sp. SL47]